MRLGIDVRHHRDAGLFDVSSFQGGLEALDCRCHEVRVESTSHGQGDSHSGFELRLRNFSQLGTGFLITRNGVVALAQIVGNLNSLPRVCTCLRAELLCLFTVEANDADHAGIHSVRCSLHGLAACFGDLHAILEVQRSCKAQGAVLAQGKTHGNSCLVNDISTLVLLQLLNCRHRRNKYGRLGNCSGVKLFFWTVDTLVQEVIAEDVAGLVKELLRCWAAVSELLAHSNALRSLPREEEGRLAVHISAPSCQANYA
mmetsp:Transcript_26529/g.47947  ORF Transcript_26529/g.47947 Transcript_26529/m.47947 type:complete len:257 (-) Transcript_26529:308-1078(-)